MDALNPSDFFDDEDAIASLESNILDIEAATSRFRMDDGVSRDGIAPFIHLMPPTAPLTSFSEVPSYSNYGVSMEVLGAALGAFVAGLAVAIAAVLIKLTGWLVALFKSKDSNAGIALVSSSNIKAIGAADRQVVQKLSAKEKQQYEDAVINNADQLRDGTLSGSWNKLTEYTLENRGAIQVLERLYPMMAGTLIRAEEKMELLFKLGARPAPRDPASQLALINELGSLAIAGNYALVRKEVVSVVKDGKHANFLDTMRVFADELTTLKAAKASGKLDLNKLGLEIEEGRVVPLDLDDPQNKTTAKVNALEAHARKLNGFKVPDEIGDEATTAFKVAIVAIKDEVFGAQMYFQQFVDVMRIQNLLITSVRTLYQRNHNDLTKIVVESENEDAKDALRIANKTLTSKLQK